MSAPGAGYPPLTCARGKRPDVYFSAAGFFRLVSHPSSIWGELASPLPEFSTKKWHRFRVVSLTQRTREIPDVEAGFRIVLGVQEIPAITGPVSSALGVAGLQKSFLPTAIRVLDIQITTKVITRRKHDAAAIGRPYGRNTSKRGEGEPGFPVTSQIDHPQALLSSPNGGSLGV